MIEFASKKKVVKPLTLR